MCLMKCVTKIQWIFFLTTIYIGKQFTKFTIEKTGKRWNYDKGESNVTI